MATSQDNDKLLEIERESAQEGKIWIVGYREDFFDRLEYFKDGFVILAEENGDVVGCIGIAFDNYLVDSHLKKGIYIFGLRTNPRYRGRVARWLKAVIQELERIFNEENIDFAYASVKSDNVAAMKILKHLGFSNTATLDFYACPVLKIPRDRTVEIDARPDISTLSELYSPLVEKFDFVPGELELFKPMIEKGKLKLFSCEGARALVYDTRGEHDFGIIKLSKGLGMFQILARALLSNLVRVPELNRRLTTWNVLLLEYDSLKAGRRVVRKIHNQAWREGVSLLNFARDSVCGSLKPLIGPLSFRVPFELMIFDRSPKEREKRPIIWVPTL